MAKDLSKQKNVYSCLELDSFIPFLAATSFAKWQELFLNTLKKYFEALNAQANTAKSLHKYTYTRIYIIYI